MSISSIEHRKKVEIQQENYPFIAKKSSKSSPIRPTLEAKNKLKRKTNNNARVNEAYKFMRSIQEKVKFKDDSGVYVENVASRIRGANQNIQAMSIAKNCIDNILFQLEMSAFAVSEEVTPDPRLSLYQLSKNFMSYRYHPEMYYSSQASPTLSSASTTISSPYLSLSST